MRSCKNKQDHTLRGSHTQFFGTHICLVYISCDTSRIVEESVTLRALADVIVLCNTDGLKFLKNNAIWGNS